jgi:hypothetical protein
MKNLILLSAAFGGLTLVGCSSAYRTAQTPDDVYFSEGPPAVETARYRSNNQPQDQAEGYASYWERQDDNMLRMKVNDRDRWSEVDDIDYWNGYNNNYWVNYNTGFNSPWMMNSWNHPMAWNNPWAWNNPMMGWNTGFNNRWGWNSGWGMGLGWNTGWGMNMGMGWNSWNNCWNNPWAWNRPITVINKYPLSAPARSSAALSPYSNATYMRPGNMGKSNMRTVSPGTSRSIWESNNVSQGSSNNSMYRTINRTSNSGGSSSYDRPARTFDGGGSSGGSRIGGSSMGGGSSSGGGSSRGGRGG